MGCGADTNANTLLTSLLAGKVFDLPDVDLSGAEFEFPADPGLTPPAALTNAMLTDATVAGDGTFDVIMQAINAQLGSQFEKSRITGADYAKVYMQSMAQALSGAIQYLTTKDNAYWQAIATQYQAKIAQAQLVQTRVELEIAKAKLAEARLAAANQEAAYALTKMKLSTEDAQYCLLKYELEEIKPAEKLLLDDQHAAAVYNLANILPKQVEALTDAHNISVYQLGNILPAQKTLVTEQAETQRANTMNTRSDGATTVVGLVGKQKDLYTQQIDSYKRDAETKAIKLFTDAWITQKTIDEGLLPPGQFSNANMDVMLNRLRVNLAIST